MFDWDKIVADMHKGVVVVTFTKADGSTRVMECTLAEYLLPPVVHATRRSENPDLVTCFDVEAEGWRSFKKSTVISVETFD